MPKNVLPKFFVSPLIFWSKICPSKSFKRHFCKCKSFKCLTKRAVGLFLNGAYWASFPFIFGISKKTIQILQQIMVKMSIQYPVVGFELTTSLTAIFSCGVLNKKDWGEPKCNLILLLSNRRSVERRHEDRKRGHRLIRDRPRRRIGQGPIRNRRVSHFRV